MKCTLRWSIVTLGVLVGLTASFLSGFKFASHSAFGDSQTETLHRDVATVMRMGSALDAHHKGDQKDLYTTLCLTLYTNAVQLLASVDSLPEDHRSRKSAVRLLGQAADYKKLHPESLVFLSSEGIIPPETVKPLSDAIARLDEFATPAEQNGSGQPATRPELE